MSIEDDNARLRLLVASYRVLTPRLIEAASSRLNDRVTPPVGRCDSEHPDGWRCDYTAGHAQTYHRHSFGGDGHLSWCDR